jgi:hypothetical protein
VSYALPLLALSQHFSSFFRKLNPSPTFTSIAASQYNTIKGVIESRVRDPLSPRCFLQGSYDQSTAIYTINDVDIIVLCQLWQPGGGGSGGVNWDRNAIFAAIAAPLFADGRYSSKVRYIPTSMCIKVDLGIKVEILPVVFKQGTSDPLQEPFRLWRPERGQWEDGFARYHQAYLSLKNNADRTAGNFIPMIKVLKHLRSKSQLDAVSFHIECLLHSFPDWVFTGGPATYIRDVLNHLASRTAVDWYNAGLMTPCGDRNIFTDAEWRWDRWKLFHQFVSIWAQFAQLAGEATTQELAISTWQKLLDDSFFPAVTAP